MHKNGLILVLISVAAFAATDSFAGGSCAVFAAAKRVAANQPQAGARIADWAKYQTTVWNAWNATAKNVFSQYMAGRINLNSLDECLPNASERESLDDILPQVFFEESVALLRQSRSSSVLALLKAMDERTRSNQLVLFRLLGHFKEATPPTTSLAGVQRGTGSIFMNFLRIPPNDWLIIFVHEILHSLDQRIFSAVERYGNQNLVKEIAQQAGKTSSPENLADPFRAQLDGWLLAGLDRGFLAEYRAWTITFEIYQDGLREELWQPIPWLDKILVNQGRQDLRAFSFHYLNPHFTDPQEGIFSLSLVKKELKNVRARLGNKIPDLANLGSIYETYPGAPPEI